MKSSWIGEKSGTMVISEITVENFINFTHGICKVY